MNKIEVIQTIGNPHSGSTLFSIILGSVHGFFNAGELKNITRDTLPVELCSCGNTVENCNFWQEVFTKWEIERVSSFKEYKYLYLKYERVSGIIKILWNLIFPTETFNLYIKDTEKLYRIIYKLSGNSVIVDSSKMPQRTLILSRFAKVKIVHLCRDFKGVLNSSKKQSSKDLNKGLEKTKQVNSSLRTLTMWVSLNLVCEILTSFQDSYKIKFKDFVSDFTYFSKVDARATGIKQFSIFSTEHMVAGNRLRLNKNIEVKNTPSCYERLSKTNLLFASIIDKVFFFWS